MKHIETYKLYERKNYDILYHFSSLINIWSIINTDYLEGTEGWFSNKNDLYNDRNIISFTRNKNLYLTSPEFPKSSIIVDGEQLSDNYKIKPHNFFHFYDTHRGVSKSDKNFEYEESLILPKSQSGIKGINKYIKSILIPTFKDFYDHYKEYVEMVDYETQFGRVIRCYEKMTGKIAPVNVVDDINDNTHKQFLHNVYDLIIQDFNSKNIKLNFYETY